MIRELVCGMIIRGVVWVFGMEAFACAAAFSLPEPVLIVLNEYTKEVPL
jgi:hypothetical protein